MVYLHYYLIASFVYRSSRNAGTLSLPTLADHDLCAIMGMGHHQPTSS